MTIPPPRHPFSPRWNGGSVRPPGHSSPLGGSVTTVAGVVEVNSEAGVAAITRQGAGSARPRVASCVREQRAKRPRPEELVTAAELLRPLGRGLDRLQKGGPYPVRLEAHGVRAAFLEAVQAATERSKELGRGNSLFWSRSLRSLLP